MGQMGWGSYLETGHEGIDTQHRTIVDLVNQLDASLQAGDPAQVEALLQKLQDRSEAHFRTEEDLMAQTRYPGTKAHLKAHHGFESELRDLIEGYRRGTLNLAAKVHDLLQDWNPMHILTEDQALVDYLRHREHGSAPSH